MDLSWARTMYVCSCNGLTDHQIRQAATSGAGGSVAHIYKSLDCSAKCGKCASAIKELVRVETGQHMPVAAK